MLNKGIFVSRFSYKDRIPQLLVKAGRLYCYKQQWAAASSADGNVPKVSKTKPGVWWWCCPCQTGQWRSDTLGLRANTRPSPAPKAGSDGPSLKPQPVNQMLARNTPILFQMLMGRGPSIISTPSGIYSGLLRSKGGWGICHSSCVV